MEDIKLKKGLELDVAIESLAFGGKGVARVQEFVIFVDRAVPGQVVRVRIYKKKKSYAEARVVELLQESDRAVPPKCKHFGECGGCSFQNMAYEDQCLAKGQQVKQVLHRLGGLKEFDMLPTLPSPECYYYRNKMEFSFSRQRWLSTKEVQSDEKINTSGTFLGFHAKGFFSKVVDLDECHLIDPVSVDILKTVRNIAVDSNLQPYSTQDHKGFWRFLVILASKNTDDLMVNIVTSRYKPAIAKELQEQLSTNFPQITSLIYSVTSSKASVAFSEQEYVLHGQPTITELLGKYRFEISPNSFFQTNTLQAERLYKRALEMAELSGTERVYDLYCGAGTISIYLHKLANEVVGFEAIESAIADANHNKELNKADNCRFVHCDLKDALADTASIIKEYGQPDVIILYPPRGGMHPKTVEAVLRLKPKRIVHVSCNPTTLARELSVLCESQYTLTRIQPVDMFPHTPHIEVVAQLQRNS